MKNLIMRQIEECLVEITYEDNSAVVLTPFLDSHNDHIEIHVFGEDDHIITDDGFLSYELSEIGSPINMEMLSALKIELRDGVKLCRKCFESELARCVFEMACAISIMVNEAYRAAEGERLHIDGEYYALRDEKTGRLVPCICVEEKKSDFDFVYYRHDGGGNFDELSDEEIYPFAKYRSEENPNFEKVVSITNALNRIYRDQKILDNEKGAV